MLFSSKAPWPPYSQFQYCLTPCLHALLPEECFQSAKQSLRLQSGDPTSHISVHTVLQNQPARPQAEQPKCKIGQPRLFFRNQLACRFLIPNFHIHAYEKPAPRIFAALNGLAPSSFCQQSLKEPSKCTEQLFAGFWCSVSQRLK